MLKETEKFPFNPAQILKDVDGLVWQNPNFPQVHRPDIDFLAPRISVKTLLQTTEQFVPILI